jgi:hypothetical protein
MVIQNDNRAIMGLSPPNVMLALGFGGMFVGLWIDMQSTPLTLLTAICATSSGLNFFQTFVFHAHLYPPCMS